MMLKNLPACLLIATVALAAPSSVPLALSRVSLAVRGGGSKNEWVCDGDVCELKPVSPPQTKSKPKSKAKSKKAVSTKRKKAASRLDLDSSSEPGWLLSLRSLLGGSESPLLQRGLSFIAKLFGVSTTSPSLPEKKQKKLKAPFAEKKQKKGDQLGASTASKSVAAAPKVKKGLSRAEKRALRSGRAGGRGRAGASSSSALRIQRELRDFQTNPPPHCTVAVRPDNLNVWVITLTGVEGTLYEGEKYKLRVEFSKEYPTKPPSVYFLKPTPRHLHVYTNGDICLDLLGKGWKPQLTVRTLAVSILSILSSAREKGIPPDNSNHADNAPGKVQEGWLYHDDHC